MCFGLRTLANGSHTLRFFARDESLPLGAGDVLVIVDGAMAKRLSFIANEVRL
jgi:hypothetical protein